MNSITVFLDELRDYEVEKDEKETYLKEEFSRLISEKYNGDFPTFMKKEVLAERRHQERLLAAANISVLVAECQSEPQRQSESNASNAMRK